MTGLFDKLGISLPSIDRTFLVAKYILTLLSKFEGVKAENWAAVNADGEYRGNFDAPKKDSEGVKIPPELRPNYPGYKPHDLSRYGGSKPGHIGMSYGWVQFTQSGGLLGKLVKRMYAAAPDKFESVFGGKTSAKALLDRLNAPNGGTTKADVASHTGQAYWPNKCEPVDGTLVWEQPWLNRWLKAAAVPEFQQAQVSQAVDSIFIPAMNNVANPLGIRTQKGLAIVADRAIQFGVTGCWNFLSPYWKLNKLQGKSEADIFAYIYKQNAAAGWSHRLKKIIETDALTWDEVILT